jgi:hypothetical protein
MAKYRTKTEDDLVWNRIRRQLTRDLDTEIQNRREEVLNIVLDGAFHEWQQALKTGELKQVEAKYTKLVKTIVRDVVVLPAGVTGDAVEVR